MQENPQMVEEVAEGGGLMEEGEAGLLGAAEQTVELVVLVEVVVA